MAHNMAENDTATSINKKISTLQETLASLADDLEGMENAPLSAYSMYDTQTLIADMKNRKSGLSFELLELQTGISMSTLKRMFKDPKATSLENFLSVANELGMKIWIEK